MSNDLHEADDLDMLLRMGLWESVGQPRVQSGRIWWRLRSRILAHWRTPPAPPAPPYYGGRVTRGPSLLTRADWLPEWHLFSLVQIAM